MDSSLTIGDADTLTEDDFVDIFEYRRHLNAREKLKRLASSDAGKKQQRLRRLATSWITDGKESLKRLEGQVGRLNDVLGPHERKKKLLSQLISFISTCIDSTGSVIPGLNHSVLFRRLSTAHKILQVVNPWPLSQKSRLIRRHHVILCELQEKGCSITEARALQQMEYSLRKFVPIEINSTKLWRGLRETAQGAFDKRNMIKKRLEAVEFIPSCKSLQHMKASGCPVCGVIHLGTKDNLSQYVRSISIKTGAETLLRIDFELVMLQGALEEQEIVLLQADQELETFQSALLNKVVTAVQRWWCCYLARRRVKAEEQRRLKSLYYYRIRRLVAMKREIDNSGDYEHEKETLLGRYSELKAELEEYINAKLIRRSKLAERAVKQFIRKVRAAVLRRRRKKHAEEERVFQLEEEKRKRIESQKNKKLLLDMRKRVEFLENRKFICIRPECCYRKFFSSDRYNTHMSLHKVEDDKRSIRNAELAEMKAKRAKEAEVVLQRIALSRTALNTLPPLLLWDENAAETEAGDATISEGGRELVGGGGSGRGSGKFIYAHKMTWNPTRHLQALAITLEVPFYHLELVSQLEGVSAPGRVPIDRRLIRVGTMADACECCIALTGAAKKEALISKIHCVLYNSQDATGTGTGSGTGGSSSSSRNEYEYENDSHNAGRIFDCGGSTNAPLSSAANQTSSMKRTDGSTTTPIVIVDNNSTYGTYIVSAGGARKVTTKTTSGMPLQPGDLICIGVLRNGPQELAPIDASNAFIVYRLCCDSLK